MNGEKKFLRKWRIIKLSKSQQGDLPARFIQEAIKNLDGAEDLLYKVAFELGKERGAEVKESFKIDSLHDAVDFISMISGSKYEEEGDEITFQTCPVLTITDVKNERSCLGFLEGFFSAVSIDVKVEITCGERCRIKIKANS
jgi:hypothetical protein